MSEKEKTKRYETLVIFITICVLEVKFFQYLILLDVCDEQPGNWLPQAIQ